jgi:quinol monooxygenase YgiN
MDVTVNLLNPNNRGLSPIFGELHSKQCQAMIQKIDPDGSNEKTIETLQPLPGSGSWFDGCLSCHLYQDAENPDEVALFEEWRDEASFAEHVNSKDYRFILEWMEMSIKKPTVTVCRVKRINL